MRHRWPEDTRFTRVVLAVEDNVCAVCGGALHLCAHRRHRICTRQGPVEVVGTLAHGADRHCAAHTKTRSPYAATTLPCS
jgi:transposase